MTTHKPPIYFNTLPGRTDIWGSLRGSVSFAQCSVMPSRASMLANDKQPRPVALRDTLVLFQPDAEFDLPSVSLALTLSGQTLFRAEMDPPDRLPAPAQQVDVGDADMKYPNRFDYTINTQTELDQVGNDPLGLQLWSILAGHLTLNIQLADNQWASDFHLPPDRPMLNGRKVVFQSTANWSATVHTAGEARTLKNGERVLYVNVNGAWASEDDIDYARLRYGANLWSTVIPWQHMRPGISLHLTGGRDTLNGSYTNIDIGPPTELLLNTIDIGMLTPPEEVFFNEFDADLHRQYFQMTPISRLVVNQYEPVHWPEICMPDGTLYRDRSPDKGDAHNGDMRQRIGKELVSLGINNASYGIHSSPGVGENGLNKHHVAAQYTAHTSVGMYANGRVRHGLSGGGSIVTLYNCRGYEFSHELGHNFGMGHNPGGFDGSVHRSSENINCGWGWDSDLGVFIPNFSKRQTGESTCLDDQCQEPFHGYSFGRDAMAGGDPLYRVINEYTLCTPYTQHYSQRNLEDKATFDMQSPTGYLKWHEPSKMMHHWGEFYSTRTDERDAASIAALLEAYRVVEVFQHNNDYVQQTTLPDASPANQGKGVYIVHAANTRAFVRVNGTQVPLDQGTILRYESMGNAWQQVDDFSFPIVRRPGGIGVPVTTLLGYYDPEHEKGAYIYSALHCPYGIWHHPERAEELAWAKNRVLVRNRWFQTLGYVMANTRGAPGMMNRFHIHIPQTFEATSVEVHLGDRVITKEISPPKGGTRFTLHGRQ